MTTGVVLAVGVTCRRSDGCPDVFFTWVHSTAEELENGDHYDKAISMAEDEGYEGPFLAFDSEDPLWDHVKIPEEFQ